MITLAIHKPLSSQDPFSAISLLQSGLSVSMSSPRQCWTSWSLGKAASRAEPSDPRTGVCAQSPWCRHPIWHSHASLCFGRLQQYSLACSAPHCCRHGYKSPRVVFGHAPFIRRVHGSFPSASPKWTPTCDHDQPYAFFAPSGF